MVTGAAGDAAAQRIVDWLTAAGAARRGHAGGRSLLDHLVGTGEIVRRWGQPEALQHAALVHSVYGTEVYERPLVPLGRRRELQEVAGEEAERLAYLFCVTPRDLLVAGTHRWMRELPRRPGALPGEPPPSRDELDAVLLLHMANMADQVREPDGSPGAWLVTLRRLAELVVDSDAVELPAFVAALAGLTAEDEALARRAYARGVAADGESERADALALAAAVCPAVGEPCVGLADLARGRDDEAAAAAWAREAWRRLTALGTAWDKRRSYEEWLEAAGPPDGAPGPARQSPPPKAAPEPAPEPARFSRYLERIADGDRAAVRGVYPDLPSRPWLDPSAFALAGYLTTHFDEIRAEILGLDAAAFHREAEAIPRTGDWDVAFLYERGRRRDAVCDACPVTARGIEAGAETVRTPAGLVYASRMRPGTHIAAHRGPTNLRVRCHLGIAVPDGDCGLRVGGETRRWTEGQCLVFDDHYEHEAWNRSDEDRIVLIVDLWHPGLSADEVRLLTGLQRYAYASARQLHRYWAANAAAAAES